MDPQALIFSTQNPIQPRIVYFITRANGVLVPLIPADELPCSVRLHGLPRSLRFDQTYGMQHVGILPYTGATFKLENEIAAVRPSSQPPIPAHSRTQSSSPHKQFQPPDALARKAIANAVGAGIDMSHQNALPQRPMSAHELTTTQWRKTPMPAPSDKTQAVIDAIVGATRGSDSTGMQTTDPPPPGHIPDQDKKEYCTYWIRTGECDYTQQGCLYKHEMPDLQTLKEIGFRGTPRWWIEKNQKIRLGGANAASLSKVMGLPSWRRQPQKGAESRAASVDGSDGSVSESGGERSELVTKETATTTSPAVSSRASSPASKVENISESDDLIDLDTPLTPATTPASSPEKTQSSAPQDNKGPAVEAREKQSKPEHNIKIADTQKVFVPAGESAEIHIAQARKRSGRAQTSSRRTSKTTEIPGLQKQIQSLQKSKYSSLMASKHAGASLTAKETQPMGRKRVLRRDRAIPIRSPENAVVAKMPEVETSTN